MENAVLIEPASPNIHFFQYARMPLLGLPILGALLRRMGIAVKIFCEKLSPIDWRAVAKADLVGITALTDLAPRAYQVAREVKAIASQLRRNIVVAMGGPHPSALPEEALTHGADFVIRGEGERALPLLVKALRGEGEVGLQEIPGLSYKRGEEIRHNPGSPLVEDLDQLPFPDFSLIEGAERINCVPIQTARGCPYDCEFCSVVQMFGRKVRFRSTESVVEELKRIRPGRHVFVVDDNFSANPERTLALLEEIKHAGIRRAWSAQERVAIAKRQDVLHMMRNTGCTGLYIGMESMNPAALAEWGKGQAPGEIEEAVPVIQRCRLRIHGMFVLGADADTPDTIRKTAEFALRSRIDTAQFFILTPAPGTRLYHKLLLEGRIFDHDWSHYDGHFVVFYPKQMLPGELQRLAIEATGRFYSLWRGVKWAVRGQVRNSLLAFYGHRILSKWLSQSASFLTSLPSTACPGSS